MTFGLWIDRWLLRLAGVAADRIDRWLLQLHIPPQVWGHEGAIIENGVCPTCAVEWPCDRYVEISERMRA